MYSLAVLLEGHLSDKTGPSIIANRFIQYRDKFHTISIRPLVCTLDGKDKNHVCMQGDLDAERQKSRSDFSTVLFFKRWIKEGLLRTYIGTCFVLYYKHIYPAKRLIHLHEMEIQSANILLTQDIHTAYYVVKRYPSQPHVFLMHTSGEGLKMSFLSMPLLKRGRVFRYLNNVAATVYKKAHRLAFVSKTAQRVFEKQYPEYAKKTIYIANGMEDSPSVSIDYDGFLKLVTVGSVQNRKSQIAVMKAMEELKYPNISLTVVGDGPQCNDYQQYVQKHHIKNITFVGAVEHSKVAEYLSKANCLISASRDEGLPMSGVEALCASLPLIMTDVGGCRELIEDNGYLIPPNNQEALVEAIRKMADLSPGERKRMGMRSREIYEQKFGLDAFVQSYKNLVDGLCADGLLDERSN